MHVHLRGGVQAYKEDWESGTRSALAGGVTVVVDQPNTVPPLETVEAFEARVEEGLRRSRCGFGVNAAVTPDADLEGLYGAGALAFGETFAAPSSYGEALGEAALAGGAPTHRCIRRPRDPSPRGAAARNTRNPRGARPSPAGRRRGPRARTRPRARAARTPAPLLPPDLAGGGPPRPIGRRDGRADPAPSPPESGGARPRWTAGIR